MATKCQLCCLPSTKPGKWPFSPITQDSWHILLHTRNHSTRHPSFGIQGSMHILVGSLESIATFWSLKRHGSEAQQENQRGTPTMFLGAQRKTSQPTLLPPPTKKKRKKRKRKTRGPRALPTSPPFGPSDLRSGGETSRRASLAVRQVQLLELPLQAHRLDARRGRGARRFFWSWRPVFLGVVLTDPPLFWWVLNVRRTTKK